MERERVATSERAPRESRRPRVAQPPNRELVLQLQRSAGNRAVAAMLARQPADTETKPEKKPKAKADPKEALLDKMTAGMEVSDKLRARMLAALDPFAASQLKEMVRLGVRFWGATGSPPELDGFAGPELNAAAKGGARAAYIPTLRFIRVLPSSSVDHVMHELAHAWDNARTGKLKPLSDLLKAKNPAAAVEAEHIHTGELMWSDAATKHTTKDEDGKKVKLTIEVMLQRARDRRTLRENQFGTPGTREGYAMKNAHEFYAEGFAVFHTGNDEQRERLRLQAPELYHLLEARK